MIPAKRRLKPDRLVLAEAPQPSDAVVGLAPANSELPVKSGLSIVARESVKVGLPCSSVVLMVEVVTMESEANNHEFVNVKMLCMMIDSPYPILEVQYLRLLL